MLELGALQLFVVANFWGVFQKTCFFNRYIFFHKKFVTFGLLFDQNVT
jgi:hypothetical protein